MTDITPTPLVAICDTVPDSSVGDTNEYCPHPNLVDVAIGHETATEDIMAPPKRKRAPKEAGKKTAGKRGKKSTPDENSSETSEPKPKKRAGKAKKGTTETDNGSREVSSSDQPKLAQIKRRVNKRKILDKPASLLKYRERVAGTFSKDQLAALDGAYLSDYGLLRGDAIELPDDYHGPILEDIAKSNGFTIKGYCAENMTGGQYVQKVLPDGIAREEAKVIYIGGKCSIANRTASEWCMLKDDHVYLPPAQPEAVETN